MRKEELHMEKEKQMVRLTTEGTGKVIKNPHDKGYKRDLANPKELIYQQRL